MAGIISGISNAVGNAADSVGNAFRDAGISAMCKIAENEIEKYAERKIEVDVQDTPDDWKSWMLKTGINSISNQSTWAFLEKSSYNQRKLQLWEERGLKKIVLRVKKDPEEDMRWVTSFPLWNEDEKTLYIDFYPRARNWSSDNGWNESGSKRWWILHDTMVFGLQLYQLPGKCFYKSDWLDNFEDVDPDGLLPTSTKKYKRWFQFRHWIMFWYPTALWGWNYQWTTTPPPNDDGTDFSLDNVLSLPSMPSLSMPSISLPSMPDISMPSLPDISAPSISAPSLSAPSLSAPDMSNVSMPSIPEKPKRPAGRWDCHGYIELPDMKVKASGKDIIFSNAKVTHFWDGRDPETKEHQRLVLECLSEEQAESWKETLMGAGVEEGDVGGCCNIA